MLPRPHMRNPCRVSHARGLASSGFARHYSRNHFCFLFLWVLRCFTSPRSLHTPYFIQMWVTGHDSSWVSPFGHPRITARLPTPQGLSQAPTSFIGSRCQGIHRVPFTACQHKHSTKTTKTHTTKNKQHDNTHNSHPNHPHQSRRPVEAKGSTPCAHRVDARVHYQSFKHQENTRPTPPSRGAGLISQGPTVCQTNLPRITHLFPHPQPKARSSTRASHPPKAAFIDDSTSEHHHCRPHIR